MDKVKQVVSNKSNKFDWTTFIKWLAKIIPWLTKGRVTKDSVIGIGALVIALGTNVGPTSVRNDVEAVNQGLEQMKPEIERLKEQNSWFFIPEETDNDSITVIVK